MIATNTTLARDAVQGLPHADEAGGLSRRTGVRAEQPRDRACCAPSSAARFPIIGVGGVLSGADACAKLDAGADLVQIYTGLIYNGPALVNECARAMRARRVDR